MQEGERVAQQLVGRVGVLLLDVDVGDVLQLLDAPVDERAKAPALQVGAQVQALAQQADGAVGLAGFVVVVAPGRELEKRGVVEGIARQGGPQLVGAVELGQGLGQLVFAAQQHGLEILGDDVAHFVVPGLAQLGVQLVVEQRREKRLAVVAAQAIGGGERAAVQGRQFLGK